MKEFSVTRAIARVVGSLLFGAEATVAIAADPFVYGGKKVSGGEAPWQVVIYLAGEGPYSGLLCGGTVVASHWVLTAAHCFFHAYSGVRYPKRYIGVAADSTTLQGGLKPLELEGDPVVHNEYKFGTWDGDIALVRLRHPFAGGKIALALSDRGEQENPATYRVVGWGKTEAGSTSKELLFADIPAVSDANCSKSAKYQAQLTERLFCAGATGKDTCKGDSGGPIYEKLGEGYAIQFGTTIAGEGCGANPGIYSRLSKYRDWISQTIATTGDSLIPEGEVRRAASACTPARVSSGKC